VPIETEIELDRYSRAMSRRWLALALVTWLGCSHGGELGPAVSVELPILRLETKPKQLESLSARRNEALLGRSRSTRKHQVPARLRHAGREFRGRVGARYQVQETAR